MILNEIEYYFSKRDYFIIIIFALGIYVYFYSSNIDFTKHINIIILTSLVIYMYINRKLSTKKEGFKQSEKIYNTLDFTKYKYLKDDGEMILCITDLENLYKINKVEYRVLLNEINNFYKNVKDFDNGNKKQIYENSFLKGKTILNIINSYGVNLRVEEDDIDRFKLDNCLEKIQMILSKYLTDMEIDINKNWDDNNININSCQIFPDGPHDNEVNQNNYNIY
tara:strand:- start:306 stop:974 length:669 start_codon:yes stop_codon:yes gene_type:complete